MALSVKGLSIGFGVVGLLYILILGIMDVFMGMGDPLVMMLGSVMIGFDKSIIGMVMGAVWGLVLGLVAGALIAVINNKLAGGKLPPIKEYKRIEEKGKAEAPPEAPPEAPAEEPPAYSPYPEPEAPPEEPAY